MLDFAAPFRVRPSLRGTLPGAAVRAATAVDGTGGVAEDNGALASCSPLPFD